MRRTADLKQTPPQGKRLPHREGSGLSWRFPDLDTGAGPLRKKVLSQRDAPGGAVMRRMSSETKVQVGQVAYPAGPVPHPR